MDLVVVGVVSQWSQALGCGLLREEEGEDCLWEGGEKGLRAAEGMNF